MKTESWRIILGMMVGINIGLVIGGILILIPFFYFLPSLLYIPFGIYLLITTQQNNLKVTN